MNEPRICIVGAGNLSTRRIYPYMGAAGAILGGTTLGLYFLLPSLSFYGWQRRQKSEALARLGLLRYCIVSALFLSMMLLPIKMILRWGFNIHYIWVWPGVFNV